VYACRGVLKENQPELMFSTWRIKIFAEWYSWGQKMIGILKFKETV